MLCKLSFHSLSKTWNKVQSSCLVHFVSSINPRLWFKESNAFTNFSICAAPKMSVALLQILRSLIWFENPSSLPKSVPRSSTEIAGTYRPPAHRFSSLVIMCNHFVSSFSYAYGQSSKQSNSVNFPWLDEHTTNEHSAYVQCTYFLVVLA